jgi:TctA family transporter
LRRSRCGWWRGLAIAAAGYYTFELNRATFDVGVFVVFGLFGVLCKILGCNRLVLIQAFAYGPLLEENIRRSLLISQGDPATFLRKPISGTLLLLAVTIIAGVAAFSAWRTFRRDRR